jgi:hypothetical protein
MEGTLNLDQLCLIPTGHREELALLLQHPQRKPREVEVLNALHPDNHPLPSGSVFNSPGGTFIYRVIGPICRLYDRSELPWPSCSIQWRGKQPSWRRVGKQFVPDLATRGYPSYSVQLWDYQSQSWYGQGIFTFYLLRPLYITKGWTSNWWYTRYIPGQSYQ